jgi:hypothetical protein
MPRRVGQLDTAEIIFSNPVVRLYPNTTMTTQTSIHEPATADGWHGVIPSQEFPAEKGRYHLYIGLFCPFAHRANFVRHLKGLKDFIDISIVKPYPKGDTKGWLGWRFPTSDDEYPGATVDHLFGEDYLHKVYFRADPDYKGRYSVPLLWDKKTGTAVCNVYHLATLSECTYLLGIVIRKVLNFSDGSPRHLMSCYRHRLLQLISTRCTCEKRSMHSPLGSNLMSTWEYTKQALHPRRKITIKTSFLSLGR